MAATNEQVQEYVNTRVRPLCEAARDLLLRLEGAKAEVDDVYANLSNNPSWTDQRTDHPPHLLTPADVLAWNTFITDLIAAIRGNAQLPIVLKGCVQPVE